MMSMFLQEVAQRHGDEFVVMVMDRAGWHIAGQLVVPPNMRAIFLPAYSPELNPAEHLWEALREDCFANHVFTSARSRTCAHRRHRDPRIRPGSHAFNGRIQVDHFYIFERDLV
jgi:transposase